MGTNKVWTLTKAYPFNLFSFRTLHSPWLCLLSLRRFTGQQAKRRHWKPSFGTRTPSAPEKQTLKNYSWWLYLDREGTSQFCSVSLNHFMFPVYSLHYQGALFLRSASAKSFWWNCDRLSWSQLFNIFSLLFWNFWHKEPLMNPAAILTDQLTATLLWVGYIYTLRRHTASALSYL